MSKSHTPIFQSNETTTSSPDNCPKCGAELVIKSGSAGPFFGCSTYPQCDFIKPLHEHESHIVKTLDMPCPECGELLVVKSGRYGLFIGCSDFPRCDFTVHDEVPESTSITCPSCGEGHMKQRQSRYGKTFFACDAYPKCKYLVNDEPVADECPQCGWPMLVQKETAKGVVMSCPQKACDYKKRVD